MISGAGGIVEIAEQIGQGFTVTEGQADGEVEIGGCRENAERWQPRDPRRDMARQHLKVRRRGGGRQNERQ